MKREEKTIKHKLIRAQESVRKKSRQLKGTKAALKSLQEETAKPLVQPIRDLTSKIHEQTTRTFDTMLNPNITTKVEKPSMSTTSTQVGPETYDLTTTLHSEEDDGTKVKDIRPRQLLFDDIDNEETYTFEPDLMSTANTLPRRPLRKRKSNISVDSEEVETTPKTIQKVVKTPQGQSLVERHLAQVDPLVRPYVKWLLTGSRVGLDELDSIYGPKIQSNGSVTLGDSSFSMDRANIYINDVAFPASKGLYDLIFLKKPRKFSKEELGYYKDIINLTNVARKGYSNLQPFRTKTEKFKNLIQDLVTDERFRSGTGLYNMTTGGPIEYKYFDNVNELVDRLRVLMASIEAGNHSHINEVNAILEELVELGIIK